MNRGCKKICQREQKKKKRNWQRRNSPRYKRGGGGVVALHSLNNNNKKKDEFQPSAGPFLVGSSAVVNTRGHLALFILRSSLISSWLFFFLLFAGFHRASVSGR